MAKFWPMSLKFWKANDKFEISTLKIEYMRNFVKIKKFFWPKMPDSKYEKAKLVENSRFHQF